MMEDRDRAEKEVSQLLEGLRQDVARGTVALYREHLAEDAIVLAIDDPRIFRGKAACLEYFRTIGEEVHFRRLQGEVEDFKLFGSIAVALERFTAEYEVDERSFRDTARVTSVLRHEGNRWLLTHLHLESLAPNRITD